MFASWLAAYTSLCPLCPLPSFPCPPPPPLRIPRLRIAPPVYDIRLFIELFCQTCNFCFTVRVYSPVSHQGTRQLLDAVAKVRLRAAGESFKGEGWVREGGGGGMLRACIWSCLL